MDRPGFKPGGRRHALPGGFDSRSSPPFSGVRVIVGGFDFPDDLHYLVDHQVWARRHADGTATVGITALGVRLAGEIYMCRVKAAGTAVEQGRSIAVVELAKSIVSVKSPVHGTVLEVNPALSDRPELVHASPYDQGWLARMALAGFDTDAASLVHGEAVRPAMEHYQWLNRVE